MKDTFVVDISSKSYSTKHTLLVGDCIDRLGDIKNKVDLIITDPPYNRNLDYCSFKDNMKEKEYFDYIKSRIAKSVETLKPTGTIYIITYPEIAARLLTFIEDNLKLRFRRWITWHYPTNIGHSKNNFTRSQRTILFFTKGKKYSFNRKKALRPYKNPTDKRVRELIKGGSGGRMMYDTIFNDDINSSKYRGDILKFNLLKNVSKNRKKGHPCQLPLNLIELLIEVSSKKGDIVLDPFAGTFTVSQVAGRLGRNSVGIDIVPEFVKIGISRLNSD